MQRKIQGLWADTTGFSLIEVMIGVAIFMFGMLSIAALLVSSVTGNLFSGNLSGASTVAANTLEQLTLLSYNDALLAETDGDLDKTGAAADQTDTSGKYSIFWNVRDDEPMTDTKTVKVFVEWTVKGNVRRINLVGVIPKR